MGKKNLILAFFLILFFSNAEGIYISINSTNGQLNVIDLQKYYTNPIYQSYVEATSFPWIRITVNDPYAVYTKTCQTLVDVQYSSSLDLYYIDQWVLSPFHYPNRGDILLVVNIVDFATFARLCFQYDVFINSGHGTCEDLWDNLYQAFIKPTLSEMSQTDLPGMHGISDGLEIQFLCRFPNEPLYSVCSESNYLFIQEITPNSPF